MKYRITILHNDGRQENYSADRVKYQDLDEDLTADKIKAFVVSLNQTV